MTEPFYVTTPIYYVNDKPHIGHAYSTVAADVLARYARLRGRPTRFLTGTDEHGQKIEEKATSLGEAPQAFVDRMSPPFEEAFRELDCSFDDYIRTTEKRHEEKVQELWRILEEKGDIYLGEYEGWYSVADEAFITEHDLEQLDEATRKQVKRVKEESYFFRLSAYQEKLLAFYEANPTFVQPEGRFNEVKSFVKAGLRDLSISRTSFRWGVPVPGNDAHVMYVWLDALTNYISALGGPAKEGEAPLFDRFWPPGADVVHIVGKDILRFHAIYWPAFLLSAGIEPPGQVWAHGWLTINGEKMSKRLGNFIPPGPLVEAFGADVVRYYLMREVGFGQDGDFAHANVLARYNGELANGLGNLLNRMVASIVKRSLGGVVPEPGPEEEIDRELVATAERCAKQAAAHLDAVAPHRALDATWELVSAANRYVDRTEPWALAKDEAKKERLARVAYSVLEALRWLSVMIAPFMPKKADALRTQLGLEALSPSEGEDRWPASWGGLPAGTKTAPGTPLFPRIDKKDEKAILEKLGVGAEGVVAEGDGAGDEGAKKDAAGKKAKSKKKGDAGKKGASADGDGYLAFDDFLKVDLRVGLVKEAEAIEKSDKLIRLQVDLGEEKPRQVLAGIREHYAPEELVGKRVVVVANLKPRKIFGHESQGMVLAASDDAHGLSVLGMEKDIDPGTKVS
ncbi:MAG TPA: methionine--tRNA ligase [Polyangiaceae bacterium LLY-WYZ-15_(1-7)]|nr:methionine--tRNA ligase [Sandaracinus sp.]HJL01323.1 methionine--tRNA ligase [Polyangiaceae bacterium LLY-WYZ-15_(1-7)]MBJ72642.1 methionine--tRNA ligase [Sandaracinus sp.]HJL13472.1 methionine--tRNA ligase [Polyangiaceae bacterium LLY-WYZ-15_(1-7)]HJL26670.1 methionine--tRNA ligase [Polyangiaceae bacterium LLY-WYZ-15_(1-7)]